VAKKYKSLRTANKGYRYSQNELKEIRGTGQNRVKISNLCSVHAEL